MYKLTKKLWIIGPVLLLGFLAIPAISGEPQKTHAEEIPVQVAPVVEIQLAQTPAPLVEEKAPVAETPAPTMRPFSLKISAISIQQGLVRVGLNKDGTLQVPANPNQAGLYVSGPQPGAPGTALITGHLDSAAGPGVFYHLKNLTAGDEIQVARADGKIATYRVDKSVSYPQNSTFPWNLVYSTTSASALRIITCDGVYSKATGHYSRNLVVYASLISLD